MQREVFERYAGLWVGHGRVPGYVYMVEAERPADFGSLLAVASGFEGAAVVTLQRLMDICADALLAASCPDARVLRGMVHLRPKSGYAGLHVLEYGAGRLTRPGRSGALLPSATAWRWVESEQGPVEVDVHTGIVRPRDAAPELVEFPVDHEVSDPSRLRLLERGATHVYVLPLLMQDRPYGMLSLEVQCQSALGMPLLGSVCGTLLEAAVEVAAPYLLERPAQTLEIVQEDPLLPVVGRTMAPLIQILEAFAAEEETLLLLGETGTGKTRLARWCHERSSRKGGPFVILDLNTVPENTQMGELFGWRRGAFTDAVADNPGYIARAQGGTLFIDEIDKLSLRAQAGLLALLEERSYRVLGDSERRQADLRFIVGTNADLRELVEQRRFGQDLFYRINVLPMCLPPLRERQDEIGEWAQFMVRRCAEERRVHHTVELDAEAKEFLARLPWPGNLRELDNLMRRTHTLATFEVPEGPIRVDARLIQQALAFEGRRRGGSPALEAVVAALRDFIAELEAREPWLDLGAVDFPNALHGLLLWAALDRIDDREQVFHLLGRPELTKNRNHHRALRRDLRRAAELFEAMGISVPPILAALGRNGRE